MEVKRDEQLECRTDRDQENINEQRDSVNDTNENTNYEQPERENSDGNENNGVGNCF